MGKVLPLRPRPLMFWVMPITRSPAQKSACKDLGRNDQARVITSEATYTPTPKRAGSRSLKNTDVVHSFVKIVTYNNLCKQGELECP